MIDSYRLPIVFVFLFLVLSQNSFSQEILTPCTKKLSETCFKEIVPEDKARLMSIYYECDDSAWTLFYDVLEYNLVAVTYNFQEKTSKEYHCQISAYPCNNTNLASALFDLIAATVYSSSYCAEEIYGILPNDLMIVSYDGHSAFSYMKDGNCQRLKDIILEIIEAIKMDNKEKMNELIPKMKMLAKVFHDYYPIPAKRDNVHKRIPALR